jgi:hypothetical protein
MSLGARKANDINVMAKIVIYGRGRRIFVSIIIT